MSAKRRSISQIVSALLSWNRRLTHSIAIKGSSISLLTLIIITSPVNKSKAPNERGDSKRQKKQLSILEHFPQKLLSE